MAKVARSIPRKTREKLIFDAGGMCANPGCNNTRLQIHHIKYWAIYKTHDEKHMIAVCPTCHDACHFGQLKITDEQLYQWKNIAKNEEHVEANIFVPSSSNTLISAGTIGFRQLTERKTIVFDLSNENKLEFSLKDEYLEVSTTLIDRNNCTVLKVTNNKLKAYVNNDIHLEQIQGRFRVTVPVDKFYLPATALLLMRNIEPDYGVNDRLIAIDLQVIKPGHIRIQGFWPNGNDAIVITEKALYFCRSEYLDHADAKPFPIVGSGDDACLIFDGPINLAMFKF